MTLRRCSAAEKWMHCSASPQMEARIPTPPETIPAREGTAAHEMAEMVLKGKTRSTFDLIGQTATNGVIFTEEMAECTDGYVQYVRSVAPFGVAVELEVAYPTPGRSDGMCIYWESQTCLHIFDYKNGRAAIEAVECWQCLNYGFGVMNRLNVTPDRMVIHIYQPRASHPEYPVRTWTLDRAQISRYWHKVLGRAEAADQPDPQATAGAHCRYCDAAGHCKEAEAWLKHGAQMLASKAFDEPDQLRTSEALEFVLDLEKVLKGRKSALESHGEQLIKSGKPVPGFSLEQGMGKRKWKKDIDLSVASAVLGVPLTEPKAITPAAAERAGASKAVIEQMVTRTATDHRIVKGSTRISEVFK